MRFTIKILWAASALFLFSTSGFASTVVGWGTDGSGEIDIPAGLTNVVAVSAGLGSSLVLSADGSVTAWGATYSGPSMPTDLTNVVAIAGRAAHNVIIRSDGTVAAWGEGFAKSFVPAGLSNMVASSTGFEHSLVLKSDTTVSGWGSSDNDAHVVPDGLSNVVAIAGGGYFSLALKGDGTVATWGDDVFGQLYVPPDLTNVVAIAAGGYHAVALKGDGTVVAWGDNFGGQLDVPADMTNVIAIAAGLYHTLALKTDGHVAGWGYNLDGQTNVWSDLSNVVAIALGYSHSLALVDGQAPQLFQSPRDQSVIAGNSILFAANASGALPLAYQWNFNGTNLDGKTSSVLLLTNTLPLQAGLYSVTASNGFGGTESTSASLTVLPFVLTSPTNQDRYVGDNVSVAVGLQGVGPFAYQWQFNGTNLLDETNAVLLLLNANTNQTGNYSVMVSNLYSSIQSSNALITISDSGPFVITSPASYVTWPGSTATFQVSAEGTKPLFYQWQFKGVPISGATNTTLALTGLTNEQAGAYTVTVTNSLDAYTTPNATLTLVPVAAWGRTAGNVTNLPVALTNVISVAAGSSHALALKPNGTVVSWGLFTFVPTSVTNVSAIAAANSQSLALRSNGTVVAWNTITTVPVNVSNVTAIAVGGYSGGLGCFSVKSNGTVVAWGLGVNGVTNVPVGLNGVIGIAAGKYHALALRGDGTIRQWADNADANLNAVPTNLNDVVAVSARGQHSIALRADGTVRAWGGNPYGETNVPSGLSNVVAVAAGEDNSLALKQDGNVVIWGRNNFGQTNIVPGISNVVQIDSGLDYNLVRLGNTNLTIVRQPRATVSLPRQQILLSVGVVSQIPFTYQWQFNGTNISDATNSFHRIPVTSRNDQGNYRVLLTTTSGIVTSAVAQVTFSGNSVIAWGNNASGQTNVPPGLNAIALAGGSAHSFALRPEGSVLTWGNGVFNLTNIPGNLTNIITIAAATNHNLVLKSDGKVAAWGRNSEGQSTVPANLSNVVAIAGGNAFSLALKSDGTTTGWGTGAPATASSIIALASAYNNPLGLRVDGKVIALNNETVVPANLSNVVSLAAGNAFGLALKTDGSVTAWGNHLYGQTNVPSGLSNIVAIAAGGYHALALKSDGTAVAWGRNDFGQTNVPPGVSNIIGIAAGDLHSLLIVGSADPAIVRQPAPVYASVYKRVLLSVGAISANALSYQWRSNGVSIAGATNSWLSLPILRTNESGNYSVIVSNLLGSIVSSNALVTVVAQPPFILSQPPGSTNSGGSTAVFQVTADGSLPLAYQWQKNTSPINVATNDSLTLMNLRRTNEGSYTIVVSNQFGMVTSSNAVLRVLVPQQLRSVAPDADGNRGLLFGDSDGGSLSAGDSAHFEVQASTNLTSWQTLGNPLTLTNGMFLLRDTGSTNFPQRFYRVIEQP